MKFLSKFVLLIFLCLTNAYAYIDCKNVPVNVLTTSTPSFHAFYETGLIGEIVFIGVPSTSCSDSTGNAMSNVVYMAIDGVGNANGLTNIWVSMLLSAEARGKTVSFHGNSLGINSKGFQVVKPYYLKTDL